MPKLGTVMVTGTSGKTYELDVYPRADAFKPLGAVVLLAKRIPFAEGEAEYTWIHVGATADLATAPVDATQQTCIDGHEANSICLLIEADSTRRQAIVDDLRAALRPPCNHLPS
jgi:hypothetical protein